MNVTLWIIAIVLAVVFLMAGLAKVSQPKEKLAEKMGWVEDWSPNAVKLIGAVEILGAIGLVLPAATGVATVLTPLAATGLAIVMLLAAVVHARRKEQQLIGVNVVLLVLAAFVAVMRFGPQAF
ncbi:DoxX family protein [Calidifontibacter indicus]|uniref:DoxX-like protein n=1 Tax=Calidifontibacter indicus TaxID=419650 RepID=A0A3D9UIT5_9MICO|nr:DoxX family protein [Calidifontibacter indicus]REF29348.1 DoxX-like protein [Calidifontibacter indicus]